LLNTKTLSKDLNLYCIEITVTQMCNFRCSYCFENNSQLNLSTNLEKDFPLLIKRIDDLLHSEWFKNKFDGLQICFWGGEPTINFKMIQKIIDIYKNNEMIYFFIYSNGVFSKRIFKMYSELKNKKAPPNIRKFRFQISYDGNPIHDLCRRTVSGKPSSQTVLKSIDYLISKGAIPTLKSTCPMEYIKYIPDCWDDMNKLYEKHKKKITYALTLDYHEKISEESLKEAEKAFIEVAKKEYKFHKEHGHFLSNVFDHNKKLCSSGSNMVTFDVDGKAYFCHGAIYCDKKDDFQYTSIYDNDFVSKIKEKYNSIPIPETPKICENCVAIMCLKCNVVKYLSSKKTDFVDKFHDFLCQPDQCEYYKIIGRIGRGLILLIEEEQKNGLRM
jgi:uncharacterized protein